MNLYAEIENPKEFFKLISYILPFLSIFIVTGIGLLGYLSFGDRIEPLIIYNLPNNDNVSILAKTFYVATICGSFVLVLQPLFHLAETSQTYKDLNEWIHSSINEEKSSESRNAAGDPSENPEYL